MNGFAPKLGEIKATALWSVKSANAREVLVIPKIAGELVGGASLMARDFETNFQSYTGIA